MRKNVTIRVDGYTRVCLTAIAVLLTVLVIGLWTTAVPSPSAAQAADTKPVDSNAGFGQTGTRLAELTGAQQITNAKLDELIKVMTSGQVKVQVVGEDGKPAGGANAKK